MRISDWSADVCSSDLIETGGYQADGNLGHLLDLRLRDLRCRQPAGGFLQRDQVAAQDLPWRGRSVDDEAVPGIGTFQPRREKGARNANGQVVEVGGERKDVVLGKGVSGRVDLGGRRSLKKKQKY